MLGTGWGALASNGGRGGKKWNFSTQAIIKWSLFM